MEITFFLLYYGSICAICGSEKTAVAQNEERHSALLVSSVNMQTLITSRAKGHYMLRKNAHAQLSISYLLCGAPSECSAHISWLISICQHVTS